MVTCRNKVIALTERLSFFKHNWVRSDLKMMQLVYNIVLVSPLTYLECMDYGIPTGN